MIKNQLFESVAIDPALVKNQLVCMILKHKFGLSNGRCISGVPRDWSNFALQQINTVQDQNLKKRLKELLRSLELAGAMVPDSVAFDRTKPWIQAVSGVEVSKKYSVLFTDEDVLFDPSFTSDNIEDYVEKSEERLGYLDVSTLKEAKEFIPYLEPFFKKHKKVVLVNRHQWLLSTKKERDLFETIFQYWVQQGGVDFTVIRSSIEKSDDPRPFSKNWETESDMLSKFLKKINFNGTFRFNAVNDERSRLHHRYLLGNYCGLSLGYGLEMVNKPHPWELLNRAHFSEAKEKFFTGDVTAVYEESHSFCYSQNGKRVTLN